MKNIELHEQSILDVNAELGQFDFIITHGVYSWIEGHVQDALLQLCAERLTTNGLAYISYNTYPGWHMGAMLREMMLYHTRDVTDERQQARLSRAFLETMVRTLAKYDNPYARCLCAEAELIHPRPDFYLCHEYLAQSNQPVYFHQFVERAAGHKLQYLAEAQFGNMAVAQSPELLRGFEDSGLDWVAREQYHDFLKGQTFRQSILCRDNIRCSRSPSPSALMSLRITGHVRPTTPRQEFDPRQHVSEDFQSFGGQTVLSTGDPLLKTLLRELWEAWPTSLPFATLLARTESRLTSCESQPDGHVWVTPGNLADPLIACLAKGWINLHVHDPAFTAEISEFPRGSPLARLQAIAGPRVANLRHQMIDLLDFDRLMLAYVDGSHDRRGLLAELKNAIKNGVFTIQVNDAPVADVREVDRHLTNAIDASLKRLAAGVLLC